MRKVFLFTHHLLITTRASYGRLHLAKVSFIYGYWVADGFLI